MSAFGNSIGNVRSSPSKAACLQAKSIATSSCSSSLTPKNKSTELTENAFASAVVDDKPWQGTLRKKKQKRVPTTKQVLHGQATADSKCMAQQDKLEHARDAVAIVTDRPVKVSAAQCIPFEMRMAQLHSSCPSSSLMRVNDETKFALQNSGTYAEDKVSRYATCKIAARSEKLFRNRRHRAGYAANTLRSFHKQHLACKVAQYGLEIHER